MEALKKNWPMFICTFAVVITLVLCTASITDALTRPRYGDAIDLISIAKSLETIGEGVTSIDNSVQSIDGSVGRIAEQTLIDGIKGKR